MKMQRETLQDSNSLMRRKGMSEVPVFFLIGGAGFAKPKSPKINPASGKPTGRALAARS
jgi:hypothetical protein